ncbi:MAG: hypothetical protein H6810_00615 [Phycisphaeraceae bacterium]|nr:MAG: hypothetical protein H6810_00615 [Phycisphaeraceae bacterium]
MNSRQRPDENLALTIARTTFEKLQRSHPVLESTIREDPNVDLVMEWPRQPGLAFPILLGFQELDELHLCAADLWCQWFPCTDAKVVEEFVELVNGLIDGRARIVQTLHRGAIIKAELQSPTESGWRTRATWSKVNLTIVPRRTETRIVQST